MSTDRHITLTNHAIAQGVHLVALTDRQLDLIRDLITPALPDDPDVSPSTDMEALTSSLWDAMDHAADGQWEGLFVSIYSTSQYYGGPEEGGWYAWHNSLEHSIYCECCQDVHAALLTAVKSLTADDNDWQREVLDKVPTAETIFKFFNQPEEVPGESVKWTWSMPIVRPGSRSYDDHHFISVEYQPGIESTVRKEVYC